MLATRLSATRFQREKSAAIKWCAEHPDRLEPSHQAALADLRTFELGENACAVILYACYADIPAARSYNTVFQLGDPRVCRKTKARLRFSIFQRRLPMQGLEDGHHHLAVFDFPAAVDPLVLTLPVDLFDGGIGRPSLGLCDADGMIFASVGRTPNHSIEGMSCRLRRQATSCQTLDLRVMLTKAQAIESVRRTLSTEFAVLEDQTVEKPYGWVIFSQTKRYIATRDPNSMVPGSGGTLVERETGRHVQFGSAYPLEINIKIYEAGYLAHDNFDLIVSEVSDLPGALELLTNLGVEYVKAEIEAGTTWRIPKRYSAQQLRQKLSKLPHRFNLGSLYFKWKVVNKMGESCCMKFTLVANDGSKNEI